MVVSHDNYGLSNRNHYVNNTMSMLLVNRVPTSHLR